jgi:hypothetical protein
MSIAVAENVLIEHVQQVASREVDGTSSCKSISLLHNLVTDRPRSASDFISRKHYIDQGNGVVYDLVRKGIS